VPSVDTKIQLLHADYCFGDVKFGGNAQAITKQRFLHHTSLLWDYQDGRMKLLKHPAKIPDYRAVRIESALPCIHALAQADITMLSILGVLHLLLAAASNLGHLRATCQSCDIDLCSIRFC